MDVSSEKQLVLHYCCTGSEEEIGACVNDDCLVNCTAALWCIDLVLNSNALWRQSPSASHASVFVHAFISTIADKQQSSSTAAASP